ncbi:hypothetical protein Tco_1170274 [Tanacetum coccineum]
MSGNPYSVLHVNVFDHNDEHCPKKAKEIVSEQTKDQNKDDGFTRVYRKRGKGNNTFKNKQVAGIKLNKPNLNLYYRPVAKSIPEVGETSSKQPHGDVVNQGMQDTQDIWESSKAINIAINDKILLGMGGVDMLADSYRCFKVVKSLRFKTPLHKLLYEKRNVHLNVKMLRTELDIVQIDLDLEPFNLDLREEEACYVKAFNDALLMEELFLLQKSKIDWLKAGDSNSAYFHKVVKEEGSCIQSFTYHRYCSKLDLINLCFADDLFLFSHGDAYSAKVIMDSLDESQSVSGLVPSLPKSTTYFCNVLNHTKIAILQIIPFEEGRLPVKYLGVPLISTRLVYRDCKELIEKVQNRIRD